MNPTELDNSSMDTGFEDLPRPPTQVRMQPPTQVRTQSSMQLASIIIYLQSHDRNDDVLFIKRKLNHGYRATFYNRTVSRGFIQELNGYDDLIQYLESFMILQVVDREACDFVQIDVPGLPAIIIKPTFREWDNIFPHIRRHLRTMCDSIQTWPKQFHLPKTN